MKRFPEIMLNQFQLAVLLDEEERHFYEVVIDNYIYCAQCRGLAKEGVEVERICLNSVNDIRVEGRCRKCGGEVARLFEFGGKKEFDEKACRLRESIKQ
jgi:hypothetical protein